MAALEVEEALSAEERRRRFPGGRPGRPEEVEVVEVAGAEAEMVAVDRCVGVGVRPDGGTLLPLWWW